MATRPIFIPESVGQNFVREEQIIFTWYAGYSYQQKQKSIQSLHKAAFEMGISSVLEISTKSNNDLGISLSAFNLSLRSKEGEKVIIEAAYQGSKIFENGGPYKDLYLFSGRDIKKEPRLYQSGRLIAFEFEKTKWPLEPYTAFYDWLYLSALSQNKNIEEQLFLYNGFSDIEFNPNKSISCQARSAALFVSLSNRGLLKEALLNKENFLQCLALFNYQIANPGYKNSQQNLFYP